MLKKFHWPLLYSPNRGENIFFSSKFFSQSDFEKKWNSVIRLFCHWNREMSEQWCRKNSICLCCIFQIGEKNFFFYENFSTNEILRKNQIQFFDYFVIGIERWVDSDAEKILLIFVVFSESGRKNFFFMKIFQPIRFREKIQFNYLIILSFESRDELTVMRKKFYWPFLYSSNRWEKIFQPVRFREKIKFNFSIILWLESSDESTVMLKKFYWSLLYSPNRGEKIFFLSKFFDQSDFEKKSNWIIRLFCHWNRGMSRQWCWKNSIDLCCILQIGEKIFFFLQNFSANQISKKIGTQLFDYFVIGIESLVNTDAEKILFAFVVFSKSGRKIFFYMRIFQPIRFRKKIELNFSII